MEDSLVTGPMEYHFPKWLIAGFVFGAICMVPWTIYLAASLPRRDLARNYDLTWSGFDVLLIFLLARVAHLAFQRRRQVEVPAAVLAAMLVMDAWFDVTSAAPGRQFNEAMVSAVFVEIPTALVAASLVWRVERTDNRRLEIRRRQAAAGSPTDRGSDGGQPNSVPTTDTNDTISPG